MSKCQEALNYLKGGNLFGELSNDGLISIEELVDKETPMKKTIKNGRPYCAKCSYSLLIEDVWEMSYCCACGQRVLWED